MTKVLLSSVLLVVLVSSSAFGQNLSGETEVGSDGKGEGFFSQYVFLDTKHVNLLTRYFYTNGVLQRGEFAAGPTLHLNNGNLLKLQFGGTTDREMMVAWTLIFKVKGHEVIYIFDGKIATENGPNTLYQKLWVPLVKSGRWQARVEHLHVASSQSFFRLGIEFQQKFPDDTMLYVAPFYDPIRKATGGQFGLRFF